MKTYLFLSLIILSSIFPQPENPGPMQAGWTSATLNREGRTLNTIIYYPAYIEGSGAQIDTSNGPYPVIAFGHGFAMQNSNYISLFKHLASYGYIVIAPQFPDVVHLQLAFDLLFCVNHIKDQNKNSSSIFFKLVDTTKVGLSGHSMGGGASLLAAANDSTINVVAPLAAAETNPSAISIMRQIKAVVYLITAQNDGITPPANHQIPMYNNALPVKGIPTLKGANHTKFMDTRIWDWTDPRGYLTPAEQLRLTRRYLTSIYNLFLKEDSSYFKYAFGSLAQNDTSIILQSQLKPLKPKSFRLISPNDTTVVLNRNILFNWNSTYSLNPNDIVSYKLLVSRDSVFNYIFFSKDSITNTSYLHQFEDEGLFYWKVSAYTSDSTHTESNVYKFTLILGNNDDESYQPFDFELEQNYPNPFSATGISSTGGTPGTIISWQSPVGSRQTIKLYDILGREIETIVDGYYEAGKHSTFYTINSTLPSGVYFYQLRVGNYVQTKKMIFVR